MNPQVISCACGCGEQIPLIDKQGRPRKFKYNHYARVQTIEHRQKLAESKWGKDNPTWKGNDVKDRGLHRYVRNHLPMPELCENCKKVSPYDLANVTDKYTREFTNWKYLCRKCHMLSDGRIESNRRRIVQGKMMKKNDALTDCVWCEHQKIQHADKDGVCLVGMMLGNPCQCIGFSSVEEERKK